MGILVNMGGLVEYQEVAEYLPLEIESFTQIVVDNQTCLNEEIPNIQSVIKASTEAKINNVRIINTPVGISLDGVKLTGYKLIIEGETKSKIQYVADEFEESVYSMVSKIPFISYIVMPDNFNPMCRITTSAFIEDIFVERVDSRHIYESISILLTAEIC